MDQINIKRLFELFLDTWDEAWARKGGATDGKIKQWAEALAGKTYEELQQAHHKARNAYDFPPTIKQFIELCSKSQAIEGWTHAKAAELTEKKLKRLVPLKYADVEMLRFIFKDLECMIFETRNDDCDFAICVVEGCYHYEIFNKAYLGSWLCVKHHGKV